MYRRTFLVFFAFVLFMLMSWAPAAFGGEMMGNRHLHSSEMGMTLDDKGLIQLAHNGQLSPKGKKWAGCHRMRKDGKLVERHWHHKNSIERGGPCLDLGKELGVWKFGANTICARERAKYVRATNADNGTLRSRLHAANQVIACLKRYRPPAQRRQ